MGIFGDKVSNQTLGDLVTGGPSAKPDFDPSQPFQAVDKPPFDPSKPFEAAPSVGLGEDAAKSTASGLASAAASTFGAAGDLRSGLSAATDYLGNKVGISPDKVQAFKDYASKAAGMTGVGYALANAPTSRDIINHSDPIVSPDYKPQTTLGGYLKTGTEFAPGLLAGGEGGLGANFLKNVAAPAIASETAGNLTAGTAAEPYARLGGALVGGVGASALARKFQDMAAARQAAKAVPSAEDTLKTAGGQFDAARDMGMVVTGNVPQDIAANMRSNLRKQGFSPSGQKPVFDAVDELHSLGGAPAVAMNDVETIRKQLTKLKMNPDGAVREAARQAIGDLNAGKSAVDPAYVIRGDAGQYNQLTKDAVGNWNIGKLSQTIEGKRNLAELNLNSPVGGLDMASSGQALQRTMKQLARPANNTNVPIARKLGFNPNEVAAITQAANGNRLTHLGDVANQVIPHWMGGGAAGSILRAMGGLSVKRQVSALDSLVRSRSPLAQQVAAQLPSQITSQLPAKTQRILRALAVTAPAVRQQMGQQASQPVSQANPY